MSRAQQTQLSTAALALLAVSFVAAVMVSNAVLKGLRLDLTESKLYTISEGTRSVLQSIDEPINLYLFFSDQGTEDVPFLRSYAFRIQEMLEEFANAADGKVVLSVVDPVPFSEEEDRASQYGLQSISLGTLSESVFLGLAGTNSVGDQETIPFFQPSKEAFLEYDLAKLIYSLARPDKTVIGLLSGVPMTVGFDPQTQQMREPWVVTAQARQLFEIRNLNSTLTEIDPEIDLLWLVQPKDLTDSALYAIDQFILGGGNALIFVDPLAEIDMAAAGANPQAMMAAGGPSALQPLLDKWGIRFTASQVVADDQYALAVSGGFGQRPIRHLGLLGVDSSGLNLEDVITADLNSVNLGSAGFFSMAEEASARLVPLITSSNNAGVLPTDRFRFLPDPATLRDDFAATGETYVLAARLEGELPSAFPDGPPPLPSTDDEATAASTSVQEHLSESTGSVGVILVGDVDILSDRLWVQVQRIFGQQIPSPFANNGDFVINALDNLTGSAELISIRSRASFARPFTTVDELRREADAQFRATEERLTAELDETEQRLNDLQSARNDSNSLMLTPEQQQEVDRFIDQRSRIRKELRAVRRNLDRDIERLGTTLKVVNIGLVPLLITIFGVVMLFLKRRRRGAV